MNVNRQRVTGRTSCWLVGGVGCLVLIVVVVVLVVYGGKRLLEPLVESAKGIEKVENAFHDFQNALGKYQQAHNGKYPTTLKELVPQYLRQEQIQPLQVDPQTTITWVYTPPKPTDPPHKVVLTHKPEVPFHMEMLGQKIRQFYTFTLQKDGNITTSQRQEIPQHPPRNQPSGRP